MQNIDEEGKTRLVLALCEGKITAEMYEQTMGESIAQTLRQWNRAAEEKDREEILERERRGLLTHEECMFVLGEGPEPHNPHDTKRQFGIKGGFKGKSERMLFLAERNIKGEEERRSRERKGRLAAHKGIQFDWFIKTVKKHEAGEISRGELEKALMNTYPRTVWRLYAILKAESRARIVGIAKAAHLSKEELDYVLGKNKI